MKRLIPWAMVWGRALLGPLIVAAAWWHIAGWILAGVVFTALVDDIADGMVARRWNCDTASLRLADSSADTVFYLGTAAALWIRSPQLLRHDWILLALLFGLRDSATRLISGSLAKVRAITRILRRPGAWSSRAP